MFEVVRGSETIPAWNERSLTPGGKSGLSPDLRLHVLQDASDALTVEVADGLVSSSDGTLLLAGRGSYEVTATLRRVADGRERVYLRLRPVVPWGSGAA